VAAIGGISRDVLSRFAICVRVLVRAPSLAASISSYSPVGSMQSSRPLVSALPNSSFALDDLRAEPVNRCVLRRRKICRDPKL